MASNNIPEYVTQMYSTTQNSGGKSQQEYINKMYDASLESEKAGLQQGYDQANAQLEEQQKKAQQQTDANLTRTYVEAEKARKNYGEVQNAYGLTSGAMAQARLAQDNQLQSDLTALRAAQQNIDAGIERERGTLAQQYAAAIQQAQANNDLQRAQALFEAAQQEENRLNQQKANAANLMAGVGDYARLAELYGLTEKELAQLMGKSGGGRGGGGGSAGFNSAATPIDGGSTELSANGQNFMNHLPYAYGSGDIETWKQTVEERLRRALDNGTLTESDVVTIIGRLGL